MGCSCNPYSNQSEDQETQFTFAPIPKRTRQYIYPEYGFEARYERVLIFQDVKNAHSFGFILKDDYWGFQVPRSEPLHGILRLAQYQHHIFTLCTPCILNSYPDTKRWPWPSYVASRYTVLHQLDQKIIYPHYDFKHLTEKYFEIGIKLNDFSIQLVKYCICAQLGMWKAGAVRLARRRILHVLTTTYTQKLI